jgi:hypothetical protein
MDAMRLRVEVCKERTDRYTGWERYGEGVKRTAGVGRSCCQPRPLEQRHWVCSWVSGHSIIKSQILNGSSASIMLNASSFSPIELWQLTGEIIKKGVFILEKCY